jgi:ATP-dependent Lon protease
MKNIKKELGQDEEAETKEIKEKLAHLKLPKEFKKLTRENGVLK